MILIQHRHGELLFMRSLPITRKKLVHILAWGTLITAATLPAYAVDHEEGGYAGTTDALGACPTNTQPVYRLFRGNARYPDDPNHRFTTNRSLYDQFVAIGWDGEGVKFCSPM